LGWTGLKNQYVVTVIDPFVRPAVDAIVDPIVDPRHWRNCNTRGSLLARLPPPNNTWRRLYFFSWRH
jgi:hypothetical protein